MLLGVYLMVNLIAFVLMRLDKGYARQGTRRIRERTFLLWAIFGGAAGILLGVYVFRHKTRHRKFTMGMPMLLIGNGIIIWLLIK